MTTVDPAAFAVSITASIAAGVVGCFALMRRMTLAADALSHVALPGIGVAIVLRVSPVLGALVMLLFGAVLIWGVERRTRIATETIIGVVFSAALAVGSLVTSGEELVEALFGGPGRVAPIELALGVLVAIGVIAFVLHARHRLVLALVSPEIARTAGVDVSRLNLRFLIMFALTIALGLRYLGVLLIGSLVIVPAATAKRVASSLGAMLMVAVGVAVLSTITGTIAGAVLQRAPGPLVVIAAATCFFVALLRPTRG